jgi:hypothetical protein
MQTKRRLRVLLATGLGLGLSVLTGCQTWMGGMTLPSGHYLEHLPQYFPQEPDFPLPRELAYQEEAAGLLAPGRVPGQPIAPGPNQVPNVVPPGPAPGIGIVPGPR